MRKAWTTHVAETRRKGNRGKKTMSHREAMRAASVTWPKAKAKLERKLKRDGKKSVSASKPPEQKTEDATS
jgi:hypothetical protein